MEHINIIGDIDPRIWERQSNNPFPEEYQFHYRKSKKNANWSVFIGNANKEYSPVKESQNIFMLVEPPEIYEYKIDYLKKFDILAGPKFPQYTHLSNYLFSHIALPWSVGISFQDTNFNLQSRLMRKLPGRIGHFLAEDPFIAFDIKDLLNFSLRKKSFISAIFIF